MDCADDAVRDTAVGEAAVTTRPIPSGAAYGAPVRPVQWLAGNALTLAHLRTAPISAFFGTAAEGDTAIAECASILTRRECKPARPGITATRSPGE